MYPTLGSSALWYSMLKRLQNRSQHPGLARLMGNAVEQMKVIRLETTEIKTKTIEIWSFSHARKDFNLFPWVLPLILKSYNIEIQTSPKQCQKLTRLKHVSEGVVGHCQAHLKDYYMQFFGDLSCLKMVIKCTNKYLSKSILRLGVRIIGYLILH